MEGRDAPLLQRKAEGQAGLRQLGAAFVRRASAATL